MYAFGTQALYHNRKTLTYDSLYVYTVMNLTYNILTQFNSINSVHAIYLQIM